MKNIITKTLTLTTIFTIALSISVSAISQPKGPEKSEIYKKINLIPVFESLAEVLNLNETDLTLLNSQFEEMKITAITLVEDEFDLVLNSETMLALGMSEDVESNEMKDWMFTDNYFTEDYESARIEPWMMEELMPREEEQTMEAWMFDELIASDEEIKMEDWMFSGTYFTE